MTRTEQSTALRPMSTRRRRARPFPWLREASPEEIGEALMTVDPMKAAQIVTYIIGRTGPELASRVDAVVERTRQDPARVLMGAVGQFLRGR